MMKTYAKLLILIPLIFVSACSLFGPRMSEEDCKVADWGEYGMNDASHGVTKNFAREYYQEHCIAKHNIAVDWKRYDAGYKEGLKFYCTEANGHRVGLDGGSYSGICSNETAARFYDGFRTGHLQYLNNEIERTESDIIGSEMKKDRMILELDQLRYQGKKEDEWKRSSLKSDIDREIGKIADLKVRKLRLQAEKNQ